MVKRNSPRDIKGEKDIEYVVTLVNPVDHRLYDVVHQGKEIYIVAPLPNELYKDEDQMLSVYGSGYFGDESKEINFEGDDADYLRSHTPSGVKQKGAGLGLILYSGMSMVAFDKNRYTNGIYSSRGDRSSEAERFWQAQISRGFAETYSSETSGSGIVTVDIDEEDIGDIDYLASQGYFGSEIENAESVTITHHSPQEVEVEVDVEGWTDGVSFIPAQHVARAGMIVSWMSEKIADLMEEDDSAFPPPEVLAELDLSTCSDPALVLNIWGLLEDSKKPLPKEKLKNFLERIPSGFLEDSRFRQDILELYGQQKLPLEDIMEQASEASVTPNKRRRVHSTTWEQYYGDMVEDEDSPHNKVQDVIAKQWTVGQLKANARRR